MLGESDARVVLVQPVDFAAAFRQVEINVSAIHLATIVVILFNIRVQIKIGNSFCDGIDPGAVVRKHYYLRFVFRVFILRCLLCLLFSCNFFLVGARHRTIMYPS